MHLHTALLLMILLVLTHCGDTGSSGTTGSPNPDATRDDGSGGGGGAGGQPNGDAGRPPDAGDDADASGVSCDERRILCKLVAPTCPQGQVPAVEGSCYGACVPIDACTCNTAADCPQMTQYTCHLSARHCGPFVLAR